MQDPHVIYHLILQRVMATQDYRNSVHPLPGNVPHMAIAITKTHMYCRWKAYNWGVVIHIYVEYKMY